MSDQTALASPVPSTVTAYREQVAQQLKSRLAAERISVMDARDGVRDCFVATYLGGVEQGLANINTHGTPEQLAAVTESMFKKRLREYGASWESPTIQALETVKSRVDQELHIVELPAELRSVHDQVCSLLLAKASGLMPHLGNRSVVSTKDSVSTVPQPASPSSPALLALRESFAAYLTETAALCRSGTDSAALRTRLSKAGKLLEALDDIS